MANPAPALEKNPDNGQEKFCRKLDVKSNLK